GIRQTFTLPASPQQNGIAERRIGMVMDVAPFVRDTSADKPSSRAVPCVFLGFPPDTPGWQFYHPTSCPVLSSQDVTFDESVSYYRLFPYRAASLPPPPLFLVPDPAEPVEVAVDSGAARGAARAGAGTGGAEPGGTERGGAETGCADSGGAACWGAEPACAESGGSPGAPLRREPLSLHRFRECYARCCRRATGATGAGAAGPGGVRTGGTGVAGAGAAGGAADAGAAGGSAGAGAAGGAAGAGAATGTAGAGATGGAAGVDAAGGAASAGATRAAGGGTGAVSAVSGGAARPRPYYAPLLQHVLGLPPSPDYTTSLVAESVSGSVCPPSVGGECALGTDVLEDRQEEFECFAAAVPHLVSMLLAPEGDPDAPDIPTPRSYGEAIEGPYSSQWQAAMDAEMASWKSTGTYVDEVPPPGANIVSGMWIFRVKRPMSSPPVFKARYVARGFSQ
ncbi:unnamed protein product, partial [Closterium sp. NIES-53]